MANGTNTVASKNRGRGAFHLYMDEFRGCNIAISVQWDHRKAMSEENSSSPIDSSRNAKIPGPRWGTHSPEQQDNPTGMHDGLRTRSTAFRCHSGSRGKNQSSHPSEISRINNFNRVHPNRGRTKGIIQAPERNKAIQEEGGRVEKHGGGGGRAGGWRKMPEQLTERLVNKVFQSNLAKTLEVYMDDLVIKSRTEHEIIRDMEKTFKTLRDINMKLNPKKCTFGIEEGTFLGYKVNTEGIMKCTKKSDFQWTAEAEAAFKEMKKRPVSGSSKRVASAWEAKQMPVYFVSRTLQGPEINYTSMEKLVVALVHASKRLKRYFQDHTIIIITYQPIKQILPRPEVVGRLQKWSIELVERPEDDSLDTPMEAEEELSDPWTLFTDGSPCIDGSGSGLVLTNPKGA
ncbi:reverse transcriptase domain-containing protein [Tanacetum coccineum]